MLVHIGAASPMTVQLVLLVAMSLAQLQQADAIHATEVPTFTWRVRVASCPASETGNVSSQYGLRRVIHSGSAWSAWTDFNATDTKHWLATYPDTSEQSSDNYFPLVTVVVIRAPPSCYSSHGLMGYEMQAKIGTTTTALNSSLDLNTEPGPANVSTFGVMTCNTTRSNGLAGPGAAWTPCWPAKVMTTREFNDRMIWHREGSPVPALPVARSPKHLPIVTTVRSVAHDVGEYSDHFVALRKLGFNQICIFEDGMTGPTKPMYLFRIIHIYVTFLCRVFMQHFCVMQHVLHTEQVRGSGGGRGHSDVLRDTQYAWRRLG